MIDGGKLEWISAPYSHKTAEGGSEANQQELSLVLKEIANKGARVIFFGGTSGHVMPIMKAAASAGMVGEKSGCAWIGFDGFYSSGADTLSKMRGSLRLMASGCPGGPNKNSLIKSLNSVDVPTLMKKHTDHSVPGGLYTFLPGECSSDFSCSSVNLAPFAIAARTSSAYDMLSQLFRSRYTTNTIASRKSPCVMDMCSHAPSCI